MDSEGVVNKELAMDLAEFCSLMGLETRIQETHRNYSYSVGLNHRSFERFFLGIWGITRHRGKKMLKLKERIKRHYREKKKRQKVDDNYKKIIGYLKAHGYITNAQIREACMISELTAFMRIRMLLKTKNIRRIGDGNNTKYVLVTDRLPNKIPSVNNMRRSYGWR